MTYVEKILLGFVGGFVLGALSYIAFGISWPGWIAALVAGLAIGKLVR